jgi:hypothetical protein
MIASTPRITANQSGLNSSCWRQIFPTLCRPCASQFGLIHGSAAEVMAQGRAQMQITSHSPPTSTGDHQFSERPDQRIYPIG